jgi:hypothetical protein
MDDSKTQIRNPKYQIGLGNGSPDSPDLIFRISDLSFAIVHFKIRSLVRASAGLVLAGVLFVLIGATMFAQAPKPAPPAAVIQQYCVTCHNDRMKTAGLILDPADLSRVAAKPELWEKVIRKLRSGAMPPAAAPRPDKAPTIPWPHSSKPNSIKARP